MKKTHTMNNEQETQEKEYHTESNQRKGALELLNKLKSSPKKLKRKVSWKNGQATLIETTREEFKTSGANLSDGRACDDTLSRVPSSWEQLAERKGRQTYTIAETPIMSFAGSGNLPSHYYVDERELEAYIQSL